MRNRSLMSSPRPPLIIREHPFRPYCVSHATLSFEVCECFQALSRKMAEGGSVTIVCACRHTMFRSLRSQNKNYTGRRIST